MILQLFHNEILIAQFHFPFRSSANCFLSCLNQGQQLIIFRFSFLSRANLILMPWNKVPIKLLVDMTHCAPGFLLAMDCQNLKFWQVLGSLFQSSICVYLTLMCKWLKHAG